MTRLPYRPIDCGLHDELQLLVLRGRSVALVVRDESGASRALEGLPVDVTTRAGAEWLVLGDGSALRLDDLLEVDGRRFSATC